MGLDCYVNVDIQGVEGTDQTQEIWYGRKENEIHGWMQRKSGIPAEDFNCIAFHLTEEIIDEFETALLSNELVPTSGFFFGSPGTAEQVKEAATALITAVRIALADAEKPYYTSWW